MIIYNITFKADWLIHEEWFQWMKEVQIPEMLATGMFTHYRLVRLLEVDETDGPTYAVQYFATAPGNYHHYQEFFAPMIRTQEIQKWGEKLVSFGTIMQVVDEL
jgi:hypothetical protein